MSPTPSQITALLTSLRTAIARPPSASYLLPLIASTTLGHSSHFLPLIYSHATSALPPSPITRSSSPPHFRDDPLPRRRVVREIKEALFKSSILIGVPKVIEALLVLNDVVEEGDKDDSFVREPFKEQTYAEREKEGEKGLDKIYKSDIEAIWKKMGEDMKEIKWLSKTLTYGTFLVPYPSSSSPHFHRDPLISQDPALLSNITLSALIPQRTEREIEWHLRGALRNGLLREEIEIIHQAIEEVCSLCGHPSIGTGMPRIASISS